jgi:hypothetical protein
MISNATKRSILRWIHLIFTIPIIGYVYSPFAELPNYAPVVRFVSLPILILSGFWMYAGVFFAIIGVALWLGAYYLSGYGAAILSEVALFIARKTDDSCATIEKIGLTRRCDEPSTLLVAPKECATFSSKCWVAELERKVPINARRLSHRFRYLDQDGRISRDS